MATTAAESGSEEAAEAAKSRGNAALKAGSFAEAVEHYTAAIALDGYNHVYYSNRSAAHLSLSDAANAIADARACILMKKDWSKGYSRLGAALHKSGEFEEAVRAYADGLRIDPSNKLIMDGMVAAQKGVTGQLEAKILQESAGAPLNVPSSGAITIGADVEVCGLKGAPEHNGKIGKVTSFDETKGRYVIELSSGMLALKPANIRPAASVQPEPEAEGAVVPGAGKVDEMKASRKVIGIDLGTTNSCVGVWVDDEVHILTSPEGRKTVPSFVAFDGAQYLVGDEAKAQQTRNIANTVYDVKRIIGQRMSSAGVQKDVSNLQYKVVTSADGDKPLIEVQFQGRKKMVSPEEISAMVLTKMKKIAEDFLGETVSRAVVTVPAYFSDAQRAATQAAGRIAGLTVERIINEPTAAALAYGLDRAADDHDVINVLVFDLGGGTFDVSILKIEGGIFEVLATGGDTRLGGEDFDLAIVEHILKFIHKEHKRQLKDDDRAFKRIKVAAQKAKEELSNAGSTTIILDKLWDGDDGNFSYELSRETFNKLIAPYTKLCEETVKRVLRDAKLKPEAISEVVLVGGSTRVPKVQDDLRALIGREELCKSVNPDECVAYGAAVQGAILGGERSDRTSALLLVDVTPLSLGVEVQGKAMSTIVKRNTPIPCTKKGIYTTCEDYQTSIDIAVYEGERSHVDGNNLLGEFTIDGIERAKRDVPKVEVCFNIDANGILTVTAEDKVTKVQNRVVIENSKGRLAEEEIERMVAEAGKFAAEDAKFTERLEARNELERLAYDMINAAQEYELEKLERKAREAQAWCDSVALTAETEEYRNRTLALQKLMHKLGLK